MVHCSCGKVIEKIPEWMSSIQVTYVCNNCPNRAQLKNIAFVNLEAALSPSSKATETDTTEVVVEVAKVV